MTPTYIISNTVSHNDGAVPPFLLALAGGGVPSRAVTCHSKEKKTTTSDTAKQIYMPMWRRAPQTRAKDQGHLTAPSDAYIHTYIHPTRSFSFSGPEDDRRTAQTVDRVGSPKSLGEVFVLLSAWVVLASHDHQKTPSGEECSGDDTSATDSTIHIRRASLPLVPGSPGVQNCGLSPSLWLFVCMYGGLTWGAPVVSHFSPTSNLQDNGGWW